MQALNNANNESICANKLRTLHRNGISAIPLKGKQPQFHIKWKKYQNHIPALATAELWYKKEISSYGIICGRVSNGIIVIDFDSEERYIDFCDRFVDLAQSYTVKTRRGYHIYYQTKFSVPSRHFNHCDIVGDGGYVVGAGSTINKHKYTIVKLKPVIELKLDVYRSIITWLSPTSTKAQNRTQYNTKNINILQIYLERSVTLGRNNALYEAAHIACKNGASIDSTIDELVSIYVKSPPPQFHKEETSQEREKEAIKTIRSAYRLQSVSRTCRGLPNSVRESLLEYQHSTIAARLLDAIHLSSSGHRLVTAAQLIQIGKQFHISKKSVISILSGIHSKVNGRRIFKRISFDKVSYVSQGDIRKPKSNFGRPIQFAYYVPSHKYLCNILRIEPTPSDALMNTDIYSASAYRRALHRELIRRLSPILRVSWFAARLNVSRRTIFRYNVQLQVGRQVMIQKRALTSENASTLQQNMDRSKQGFTPGLWLETSSGKRYPALKNIAQQLLRFSHSVRLCRQLPTRYTLDSDLMIQRYGVELPKHLQSRATCLTYENIQQILSPDWATRKYDLGGYLAIYNGFEWVFRPPLRAIAYPLVKQYEDGLVYFIRPIKQ